MLNNLGNLASLLKNAPEIFRQAQEMQGRMQKLQESLAKIRVEGDAGGGMVRVEASGQQKILAVHIEKSLCESGDQELLEDLIAAATNAALDKSREAAAQEMSQMTGDMNFPGLGDALSKMGLGPGTQPS